MQALVNTMETTVSSEFTGNWRDYTEKNLDSAFIKLYKALNASRLADNTDILLFSRRQELLYPRDETDRFESKQLVEQISIRLPSLQEKKIYTIRVGAARYLILSYPLTNLAGERPEIVFVAHMTAAAAMLRSINLVLICIMLLGAALSALIVSRLSSHIARPVTELYNMTKEIGKESMRLGTLVEELLTLSRIESQAYTKELFSVNLCDILKEYVQRLGGLAAKQQRQLTLTLPDTSLAVQADDTLLSQAVMNIVSNCIRYAKTAVHIELLPVESNAVIRISDDGHGIPETDLPHIFERFYKGKGGHSGLGLAIAKSAVEFMGGSVRAYNGKIGAVFEIALPVAAHVK